MDPESVLAVVASALFGVVVWVVALPVGRAFARSCDSERVAWWRLMWPLFSATLVCAFLVGWAVQEADPADEHAGIALQLLAVLTCGVGFAPRGHSASA